MAENYNLGSKFGFNVTSKGANLNQNNTLEQKESSKNLFSAADNFFAKYEDVLNGKVAHEINMYSRQAMIVGMNLKASDTNVRKFDVNI